MGSSMSRETLAQIESGRRNIKASDLKILKEALSTTYDELLKE
jgi:transcriptional regulator with XRE-family HTH domain